MRAGGWLAAARPASRALLRSPGRGSSARLHRRAPAGRGPAAARPSLRALVPRSSPTSRAPCPAARRLPADDFRAVRRLVIRIILATDMARHHE